ncbi:NUDIX domain-containing protein [Nonomuraea guangzhouensis]|uniref:NUDIX domain-containing protein n=1 Tax=Nonomuraea guangzhouensis TaxID=1291555 RepID=A0ABW4GST3_9ACTN|nr:NUDIX domain-containing protein [Nonomuraea guangzhouensis]
MPQAAVREVEEETGYDVEVTGMVGLYTDARHIIAYSDGEVRRQFNICLTAHVVGGALAISDESTDVRWVSPDEIEDLPMHDTQRLRIEHFLQGKTTPHIG